MGGKDRRQGAVRRPAPRTRSCRPALVEVFIYEVEVLGPAADSRCRYLANRNIRKTSASNTAFSICAASASHNIMLRGR